MTKLIIYNNRFQESRVLPQDWKLLKLSDFAKTTSGGTPNRKKKEYYNGKIPWVKSGELRENLILLTEEHITEEAVKNSSAKLFPKGTLLVAMYGATVGRSAILGINATTNQAVCAIFPEKDIVDEKYLQLYLIFDKDQMLGQVYGGAQPNISQNVIRNLKIPFPPLPEQKKIAAILTTVQEDREKTEAVIKAARQLKKSMMKHLFTYGPVSVKETEKVKLKETEIGTVPEEWSVKCIDDILTESRYGLSKKSGTKGKYPNLGMNNLKDGKIVLNGLKKLDLSKEEFEKFSLRENDILFNRTNSIDLVGKTSIFKNESQCVFASYLIRLRLKEDEIIPDYFNYHFNRDEIQHELKKLATRGVSQSNISATKLKGFKIPVPPVKYQREIIAQLFSIDQKIAAETAKKEALDQLFQSLLQQLMTGDLRVADLDI